MSRGTAPEVSRSDVTSLNRLATVPGQAATQATSDMTTSALRLAALGKTATEANRASWLMLIRGAEELTERHEAEYFAQVPKDELCIDLVRALESLPDMYREVILLRDMEQLTIGEVADHLRITREACKSRIHRGRALLREYLQGDNPRGEKK